MAHWNNCKIPKGWFCFLLFWMGAPLLLTATDVEYVRTIARPGDGVISLLRYYNLFEHECNVKHFYKINKLPEKSHLKVNEVYYLPIYIYLFNGKTIRSSIGDDDWSRAVRIQKYNETLVLSKLLEKDYRVTKLLWVPHHEMDCNPPSNALIPESDLSGEKRTAERTYPIFGKEHAHVPLLSKTLEGSVFYVVSGHGGPDPGAVGKRAGNQLCEDEYAYDVSLRLARKLIENGATVYMITRDGNDGIRSDSYLKCDSDESCWKNKTIPAPQKSRLIQRATAVNDLHEAHRKAGVKNQRLISIHVDSRSKGERIDLFFYHFPGSKTGKKFAETLHKTIGDKYHKYQKGRGYSGTVTARDLHMLRETKPVAVYVELGNIRNSFDQHRFTVENNRQALANWLYAGIEKEIVN